MKKSLLYKAMGLRCWYCGGAIHPLDTTHAAWCSRIPRATPTAETVKEAGHAN